MTWKEHAVVFLQEINSQSAVKKSDKVNGKPGFTVTNLLPYPCSGKNLISNLVTDYIQNRRGEPGLFSFEYNLLPKLISNFYHYMDQALGFDGLNLNSASVSCALSIRI